MNLQSRIILKENRRSLVLRCLISFILSITIGIAAAVSAAAYTEITEGATTTYSWNWGRGTGNIRPYYSKGLPTSSTPKGMNYKLSIGSGIRDYWGTVHRTTLWETIDCTSGRDYPLLCQVESQGSPYISSDIEESPYAIITVYTESIPEDIVIVNSLVDISVNVSTVIGTIRPGDSAYDEWSDMFTLSFVDGSGSVLSLQPTLVSSEKKVSLSNYGYYDTTVHFVLDSSEENIQFDKLRLSFPLYTFDSSAENGYYYLYKLGVENPVLDVIDYSTYQMIQANIVSNDDLITKLGTVNTVDQARINAQNSSYSEVSTVTGSLSGMTDFSESLSSQVDLSQEVDVLSNGSLVDSVNNMWDLFPWDSQFMTTSIGMVGSIALLSLVLHGGERALFSSKGSRKSSKKGDDS